MKSFTYIQTLLLLALTLTLITTSCSDDNFINQETETDRSTPDTIDYVFASGVIYDTEGNELRNTTVEYVQDGNITSVTTDDLGKYEIRKIDDDVQRLSIRCHKDGYLPRVEILQTDANNAVTKDVILASEDAFTGGSPGQISSLSVTDSLISVSGRLLNEAGNPVAGLPIFVLDLSSFDFVYSLTDAQGNWSVAIQPIDNAIVALFNPCEELATAVANLPLPEDTDIGDVVTDLIEPNIIDFTGFVTDCNTQEGLVAGTIEFIFPYDQTKYKADIQNGTYQISFNQCQAASCVDITIISRLPQSGVDSFTCQTFTQGANSADFEVCNTLNPTDNGGYLSTLIEGNLVEYEFVGVEVQPTYYVIAAENVIANSGVVFVTESLENSGTFKLAAVIGLDNQMPIYTASEGTINYQIDSTTTEFLYGTYFGNITDVSNEATLPIEGEFKAKFQ